MGEKDFCPDCGPAEVPHFLARSTVAVGFAAEVLTKPLAPLQKRISDWLLPRAEPFLPPLFRLLQSIGAADLPGAPDGKDTMRTVCLWEAAKKRGIEMRGFRLFGRPTNIFFAVSGGRTVVFEGLPRPAGKESGSLVWMDDKGIMKKKFRAAGIPVARGGVCASLGQAKRLFRKLRHPVITKPNVGSRSRHTTIHIETEAGLEKGFRTAKALSPWVIVEEELSGFVFRVTLIGGKLAGVLRREPPFVSGDGARTVRELVVQANADPKRRDGIFHAIAEDAAAAEELRRQGLSWESVPARGRFVPLHQKVGRSQGGTNSDVTERVHPENRALFEKIAAVLGDPLVGVDFIIADMARPWQEQPPCGAIECNSLPFLDLHRFPFRGEARDLSGMLWDLVFPDAAPRP